MNKIFKIFLFGVLGASLGLIILLFPILCAGLVDNYYGERLGLLTFFAAIFFEAGVIAAISEI